MPKFGQSSSGRRQLSAVDGLVYDNSTGAYVVTSLRPPQMQNDNDLRLPTSPLEKPRLGIEARRQLRAELFGPTPEPISQRETVYTATSTPVLGRPGPTLVRTNTLVPPKSTTPIDIHAAFAILKELKKTATTEELVALHRALLPEIAPQQPQPESIVHYVETVPPQNAEMRRRRSLFRPGEATRSEIEEATKPGAGSQKCTLLKTRKSYPSGEYHPLTPPNVPRTFTSRTATPSDLGRSYLGNYKLGSLHITNGAESPTPVLRLQHTQNPSSTTLEKEDDYYTASEGSIKREDVFDVRHDDGVTHYKVVYEPSIDLYEDKVMEDTLKPFDISVVRLGDNIVEQGVQSRLNRRSTNDTIISTSSNYSCSSQDSMEVSFDQRVTSNQQTHNLIVDHPEVLQPRKPRAVSSSEWVEDVDPQFLECNTIEEGANQAEEYAAASIANPYHDFQPRNTELVVRQKQLLYCQSTNLLLVPSQKQDVQRDSAYGAEVLLREFTQNPQRNEQSPTSIGVLHDQSTKSPEYLRSPREIRINNLPHQLLAVESQSITDGQTLTALPPHDTKQPWVTQQTILSTNSASSDLHTKPLNPKGLAVTEHVMEQKRSPRKLQKKRPISHRAQSNPIIVQRQRSIDDCPYLPVDIMFKHSQRLDKSPGMDHLERTYKSVTTSGSRESLLSLEPFHQVELRFPSPTPESVVVSRGRKTQRSCCGPFGTASGFFRSKSRKTKTEKDETTDNVPRETRPVNITELSNVTMSAGTGPYELARSPPGTRRVPSGPRAMVPSGQHVTRSPIDRPMPGIGKEIASELVLSKNGNRQLNHAKTLSAAEQAVPEKLGDLRPAEDEIEKQADDTTENLPVVQTKRYSMLDRPRGSYYGDWLQPVQSARKTQRERSAVSPSPRSRRRTPQWEDAQHFQLDNGSGGDEDSEKFTSQNSASKCVPSPSRLPPPLPKGNNILTLPKLRPTIRAVDLAGEETSDNPQPRSLCAPVRVSISFLKTRALPTLSPPDRAPPPPPSTIPSASCQVANSLSKVEHDSKTSGKYVRTLSVALDDRPWKKDLDQVDVYNW